MADCIHIPHETLNSCKQCGASLTSSGPGGRVSEAPAPPAPPPVHKPATQRVAEKHAIQKGRKD